ncbi:hypothetical protein [Streptomyces sp. NPDC048445]|uniref:hypothetical protein n=1 Tax=Streptomyces sp. NPDC048445 TaxID=3365553 RepID=UPI00371A5ADE
MAQAPVDPPPGSVIPGHCWAHHPDGGGGTCMLPPHHRGPHYNPYIRAAWNQPGLEWPQQPAR